MESVSNLGGNEGTVLDLPYDVIVYEILSRLPIKSLIRCRRVCKRWYDLTKDQYFIELQLNRASRGIILVPRGPNMLEDILTSIFLVDKGECKWEAKEIPVKSIPGCYHRIVGSCNGLLCVASHGEIDLIFIYNPITRECVMLPESDLKVDFWFLDHIAFGYDPTSKKYKVARLLCDIDNIERKGEIITLGENSWRRLDFPYPIQYGYWTRSVFLDGAFHWMIDRSLIESSGLEQILSLDICSEKFRIIRFPPSIKLPDNPHNLINLGESLALIESNFRDQLLDIWQIVGNNTEENCIYQYTCDMSTMWTKFDSKSFNLVDILSNGSFLFVERVCSRDRLSLYFPAKKEYFIVEMSGNPQDFDAITFVPSLVSLSAELKKETRA